MGDNEVLVKLVRDALASVLQLEHPDGRTLCAAVLALLRSLTYTLSL